VRQGDGTYVSSLEAGELLEPTLLATRLLRGRTVLELFEVRRMLEPEAAAVAAQRADADVIGALHVELDRMIAAGDRADELVDADAAFHDVIAGAPGNGVLRALLRSLSTSTVRARLWHGIAERGALDWRATSTSAFTTRSWPATRISPGPRPCCTSSRTRPGCVTISGRRQRPARWCLSSRPNRTMNRTRHSADRRLVCPGRRRNGAGGRSTAPGSSAFARSTLRRCTGRVWLNAASAPSAGQAARRVRPLYEGRRLLRPGASGWEGSYFDFSYDGALRSLAESLGRLGLDRVDVALVHDPDDHYQKALDGAFRALTRLRDEGTVRAIASA